MPRSIHDKHISEHRGAAQIHANNRAMERLGIEWNREKSRELIDKLGQYGPGIVSIGKSYRKWFHVTDMGAWVLYDRKLKRIVTILDETPRDVLALEKEKVDGQE